MHHQSSIRWSIFLWKEEILSGHLLLELWRRINVFQSLCFWLVLFVFRSCCSQNPSYCENNMVFILMRNMKRMTFKKWKRSSKHSSLRVSKRMTKKKQLQVQLKIRSWEDLLIMILILNMIRQDFTMHRTIQHWNQIKRNTNSVRFSSISWLKQSSSSLEQSQTQPLISDCGHWVLLILS